MDAAEKLFAAKDERKADLKSLKKESVEITPPKKVQRYERLHKHNLLD